MGSLGVALIKKCVAHGFTVVQGAEPPERRANRPVGS